MHVSAKGISGRTGIFELLVVDEPIRQIISLKADAMKIRNAAVSAGDEDLEVRWIGKGPARGHDRRGSLAGDTERRLDS